MPLSLQVCDTNQGFQQAFILHLVMCLSSTFIRWDYGDSDRYSLGNCCGRSSWILVLYRYCGCFFNLGSPCPASCRRLHNLPKPLVRGD